MKCVSFYRNEGYYDLCHPKDKSAQYYYNFGNFTDLAKEKGIRRSYLVDFDKDNNYDFPHYTALELAYEIQDIYSSYWLHSGKVEVRKLIDFLNEIQEENDMLMYSDMIEECDKKIEKINNEKVEWKVKLETATNQGR